MASNHESRNPYEQSKEFDSENCSPESVPEEWKPSGHELLVIITLAIVSLLVALDASVIVTSISVSPVQPWFPTSDVAQ